MQWKLNSIETISAVRKVECQFEMPMLDDSNLKIQLNNDIRGQKLKNAVKFMKLQKTRGVVMNEGLLLLKFM